LADHGHAKDVTKQTKEHTQGNVRGDPAYAKAELELRTLIERFANDTSMQGIIDAIDQIYTDVQNDPELKSWFTDLNKYVRRVLQEPGFVMKDQCDQEGRRLKDNSKGLFNERYRVRFTSSYFRGRRSHSCTGPPRDPLRRDSALLHLVVRSLVAKSFLSLTLLLSADDPLNKQFGEDWKLLTKDLLLDSEGNFKYKPHLWQDVRGVILPALLKNVGYVPIPRVEYTDNMIDLVIENLTLESQNIIPNIFEIEARTYHKVSLCPLIPLRVSHSCRTALALQRHRRQVEAVRLGVLLAGPGRPQGRRLLYILSLFPPTSAHLRTDFKKKSGFPKISDHGLADVFIGGSGISGKVHIESTDRRGSVFHVREVKVKIDTLKFKLRDTKHNFLYATIRPLATGLIKKRACLLPTDLNA
jgi:hypothetical protein